MFTQVTSLNFLCFEAFHHQCTSCSHFPSFHIWPPPLLFSPVGACNPVASLLLFGSPSLASCISATTQRSTKTRRSRRTARAWRPGVSDPRRRPDPVFHQSLLLLPVYLPLSQDNLIYIFIVIAVHSLYLTWRVVFFIQTTANNYKL